MLAKTSAGHVNDGLKNKCEASSISAVDVAITNHEANAFWTVNLERYFSVKRVVVTGRKNTVAAQSQTHYFEISVGNHAIP